MMIQLVILVKHLSNLKLDDMYITSVVCKYDERFQVHWSLPHLPDSLPTGTNTYQFANHGALNFI